MTGRKLPSIGARLSRALALWSLAWGLAVGAAVWTAASTEVDELLDEALQSTAGLMAAVADGDEPADPAPGGTVAHFAWQVIDGQGRLHRRSDLAPTVPWQAAPRPGFSDAPQFRLFGVALGTDGRMLYVAQTREERLEAQAEVALAAVLAALSVGLVGHVWLRSRVKAELMPLDSLASALGRWDPTAPVADGSPGHAERRELRPVHDALDGLASRLRMRLAHEKAFAAHAAHALRTPLAGIDAQLAVAVREAPPELRDRLLRIREGAARLRSVVGAVVELFRSGAEPLRRTTDLAPLLQQLAVPGVLVQAPPSLALKADPDLVAAALLNLLDNAKRHGATEVRVTVVEGTRLRVADNGPGVPVERRRQMQAALDTQAYDDGLGLGLTLADRVARAHGGRLRLLDGDDGFVVELGLAPA
ncbi:sensor histidine kinase KdpD [Aquabacterium sp. J223]|uniref:sensor histidine kinase n=1 Tax=Aquabacterium sp. J223 TaxID=2898431 RepID=UPI0021ADCD23|nr:ATP-binding protein [Aquabacterium sp. J223]UUX97223.1 ATP-binding protein [Aquabacterium sp. J223]